MLTLPATESSETRSLGHLTVLSASADVLCSQNKGPLQGTEINRTGPNQINIWTEITLSMYFWPKFHERAVKWEQVRYYGATVMSC